jgi:spore germination protein KC
VLSGCWSKQELNEIAVATALGIDKTQNGYLISVQILNPGEIASKVPSQRTPVFVYSVKAKTIFEGLRKLTTLAPRKIYLAHLRLVIFGEKMARQGIEKPLDFLSRDPNTRADFFIAVARETTAISVLQILTPMEKIPANRLFTSLEMSEKNWAPAKGVVLDELVNSIVSKGKNPVLTGIRIKGDPRLGGSDRNVTSVIPHTALQLTGLGVFKNDKLVGWLNESDSKAYNYITGNVENTVGSFLCDHKKNERLTVEVTSSKVKTVGTMQNGKPSILVKLNLEENIGEIECAVDVTNIKTISLIEKRGEKDLEKILTAAIKTVQHRYESDIFGFGEVIHRKYPKEWAKWKQNWGELFKDMDVRVQADVKIRRIGTINQPIQNNMGE